MYLLFRYKNWKPQDYMEMGRGARKVVGVFLRKQLEEEAKERQDS